MKIDQYGNVILDEDNKSNTSQERRPVNPPPRRSPGKWLAIVLIVIVVLIAVFKGDSFFKTQTSDPYTSSGENNNYVNQNVSQTTARPTNTPVPKEQVYDMGIPNLNGKVYYQDDMNVDVLWVHHQLKATGKYYQGEQWDETGNLGDRTMSEIARFMRENGYGNHSGCVDQRVINALVDYLGPRVVPVYVGGFYDKMGTIMSGGSAGSMYSIDENSSTRKIKWVQACLSKLGYYNYSIDGDFGSRTIKALNSFQHDHGYVERDYVSLGVARKLIESCYYSNCYLGDLP